MGEVREHFSGKDHLEANLKAKKGMQLANEEGTLRKFSRRERGLNKCKKKDDLFEWKEYCRKGEEHRKKLENAKPDIVERINEHIR